MLPRQTMKAQDAVAHTETMPPCPVCGGKTRIFHVGTSVIGGHKCATREESLTAPVFPLDLIYCPDCTTTMYRRIAGADRLLAEIYQKQSSTYALLPKKNPYIADFASRTSALCQSTAGRVLEIGCNDGALLQEFRALGHRPLGIEPSLCFEAVWKARDLEVINGFFDRRLSDTLSGQVFDIIVVRHVLEHIANPQEFIHLVAGLMSPASILVIESPYLPTVLNAGRFENISYAHLNHFTLRSIATMGKNAGLGLVDSRLVETDGGSFVAVLRPGVENREDLLDHVSADKIEEFLKRMHENGARLRRLLDGYEPGQIIGYGTGAKGPHLLSLYQLGDRITEAVDDNAEFHGLFLAGLGTRICSPDRLRDARVRGVLNLAPTHSASIRDRIPKDLDVIEII